MILELCSIVLGVAIVGVVYYRLKHRKEEETYVDGSTLTYDDIGYPPPPVEQPAPEPVAAEAPVQKKTAPKKKAIAKKTAPKKRGRPAKKGKK